MLSVTGINDHGYNILFKTTDEVEFFNDARIITEGKREGKLFYMNIVVQKMNLLMNGYTLQT